VGPAHPSRIGPIGEAGQDAAGHDALTRSGLEAESRLDGDVPPFVRHEGLGGVLAGGQEQDDGSGTQHGGATHGIASFQKEQNRQNGEGRNGSSARKIA
jgi:hypothetical protein